MKQHILVPLDGSALAETVVPHAEALARLMDRTLLLLHVVTPAEISQTRVWIATVPADLRREWEETRLSQIHTYLAAVATRLQAEGLHVRTEVLMDHDPAAAIVGRAERDPAVTLIAMATHGRSGLSRWMLGSVAAKVLQAAPKPLLLLRARQGAEMDVPEAGYRMIVVPLDGSAFAEQALEHAQVLAAASNADLVLVAAVPAVDDSGLAEAGVVPYWMEAACQAEHERVDHYLTHLAKRLALAGLRVHTRLVTGPPAEVILRAGAAEYADLIVMTTHGRSGLPRLWLGSVAAKVAQGAEVPLLLVRARVEQEDKQQEQGANQHQPIVHSPVP
jgi:nucleotide-binding universal stress UspA family protein